MTERISDDDISAIAQEGFDLGELYGELIFAAMTELRERRAATPIAYQQSIAEGPWFFIGRDQAEEWIKSPVMGVRIRPVYAGEPVVPRGGIRVEWGEGRSYPARDNRPVTGDVEDDGFITREVPNSARIVVGAGGVAHYSQSVLGAGGHGGGTAGIGDGISGGKAGSDLSSIGHIPAVPFGVPSAAVDAYATYKPKRTLWQRIVRALTFGERMS